MAGHKVYSSIVKAIKEGKLKEPFSNAKFRIVCPGHGAGTYKAFLHKHRKGNPGGNSELFIKNGDGSFTIIRPLKYGL